MKAGLREMGRYNFGKFVHLRCYIFLVTKATNRNYNKIRD